MSGWIFIEAQDVWMFRDAKPFNAGSTYVARSLFPPTPNTIQGIIRTHALEQRGVDWRDGWWRKIEAAELKRFGFSTDGRPVDLGDLKLRGPFVAHRDDKGVITRYVPLPLDLLVKTEGSTHTLASQLQPQAKETVNWQSSAPQNWLPLKAVSLLNTVTDGKPSDAEFWLDAAGLEAWQRGGIPTAVIPAEALYQIEDRVGLALEQSTRTYRRVKEGEKAGLLYRARFIRPCAGVGLLTGVADGMLPQKSGTVVVGGEARVGHYAAAHYAPSASRIPDGRIKVVLLTPAYFSEGAYPANGNWKGWLGPNAQLISAVIGKPQAIGGFDVNRGSQKPMFNYVPAGSVYFFEGVTLRPEQITETPDGALDHQALGFGEIALGSWNYAASDSKS